MADKNTQNRFLKVCENIERELEVIGAMLAGDTDAV